MMATNSLAVCNLPEDMQDQHPDAPTGHSPLIVVVDGSSLVRKMISIPLQRAQFQVCCYANGRELLNVLHEPAACVPDLILLAIDLPKMRGFQVTYVLKHASRVQRCPLLIISPRTTWLNSLWARLPGVGLLETPFSTGQLLAAVRNALASSPSHGPRPAYKCTPFTNGRKAGKA
jgi:chemosensory pili system protein ChpA (sensor histidine kinase/response regulator)